MDLVFDNMHGQFASLHWLNNVSGVYLVPGFRIRIRMNLSCWIRIRSRIQIADPDPGGKKITPKIEKRTEFSSFEVLDVHFLGLKASPVAWASFMEA
jgi:hypothetical protein